MLSLLGKVPARRMVAVLALAFVLSGLALASVVSAAPQPPDVFAVDNANNLIRFNSATPGTIESTTPITGLGSGERIFNIDFRPKTGQLYGDAFTNTPDPDTNNIYSIDPATGAATKLTPASVTTSNSFVGLDFNPVTDRLRYVNGDDENLQIDPTTGAVTRDTSLAFASGDQNERANPNVVGSAYSNNLPDATSTTLYGIDSDLDILVTQDPPRDGALETVGPLSVDTRSSVGFDIGSNGTAYAALYPTNATASSLYTIDLSTGAATRVGAIGDRNTEQPIQGLAVVPFGSVEFSATTYSVNENAGTATITVTRTGGASGPVTVDYATSNGTAAAGSDYTATSGTLSFASGETSKTFTVPISDDTTVESDETVNLTLSNPTGGADLGTQSTATLTIADNDDPPSSKKCTIKGKSGNDNLTGTNGDDVICGKGGNDTIDGKGGNDTIRGGDGKDRLIGGPGSDNLLGEGDKDKLNGIDEGGSDTLDGGDGKDKCKKNGGDTVSNCP